MADCGAFIFFEGLKNKKSSGNTSSSWGVSRGALAAPQRIKF
jgi:hypothetical protein